MSLAHNTALRGQVRSVEAHVASLSRQLAALVFDGAAAADDASAAAARASARQSDVAIAARAAAPARAAGCASSLAAGEALALAALAVRIRGLDDLAHCAVSSAAPSVGGDVERAAEALAVALESTARSHARDVRAISAAHKTRVDAVMQRSHRVRSSGLDAAAAAHGARMRQIAADGARRADDVERQIAMWNERTLRCAARVEQARACLPLLATKCEELDEAAALIEAEERQDAAEQACCGAANRLALPPETPVGAATSAPAVGAFTRDTSSFRPLVDLRVALLALRRARSAQTSQT